MVKIGIFQNEDKTFSDITQTTIRDWETRLGVNGKHIF